MSFNIESVRINTIDTDDTFYRITTNNNIDDLAISIKSIGLLHPPILIKNNKTYQIISGFRRIHALTLLGHSNVDARILNNCNDDSKIIKIAISENSYQRPLNIVEKARSIKLLSSYIHNSDDVIQMACAVGIQCDNEFLTKLLRISDLNEQIQEGIIHEFVSIPVALILADYDDRVSNLFISVFKKLKLGLNRQRLFITLVDEISSRDDMDAIQIMKDSVFTEVLNDDKLDKNQKIQILFSHLREMRYPEISKAEERFKRYIKDLRLGKGIKLIHPKQFEDTNYAFQLTFKNINDINSLSSHLGRIINDPKFKKVFNN